MTEDKINQSENMQTQSFQSEEEIYDENPRVINIHIQRQHPTQPTTSDEISAENNEEKRIIEENQNSVEDIDESTTDEDSEISPDSSSSNEQAVSSLDTEIRNIINTLMTEHQKLVETKNAEECQADSTTEKDEPETTVQNSTDSKVDTEYMNSINENDSEMENICEESNEPVSDDAETASATIETSNTISSNSKLNEKPELVEETSISVCPIDVAVNSKLNDTTVEEEDVNPIIKKSPSLYIEKYRRMLEKANGPFIAEKKSFLVEGFVVQGSRASDIIREKLNLYGEPTGISEVAYSTKASRSEEITIEVSSVKPTMTQPTEIFEESSTESKSDMNSQADKNSNTHSKVYEYVAIPPEPIDLKTCSDNSSFNEIDNSIDKTQQIKSVVLDDIVNIENPSNEQTSVCNEEPLQPVDSAKKLSAINTGSQEPVVVAEKSVLDKIFSIICCGDE